MTLDATTLPEPVLSGRDYQRRVAALLEAIDAQRSRIYALRANGATPAGLGDLKGELRALRRELAATVAARAARGRSRA